MAEAVLHSGSAYPIPEFDRWNPPTGEVHWLDATANGLSTSGPSLMLATDFTAPRAAGREQIVVVRIRSDGRYLPTANPDWQDPEGHLAVTATVVVGEDGGVEQLPVAIPYGVFPEGSGGLVDVEVAVHEPVGTLVALGTFEVELPADVDRVPDLLTVTAHTLVALVKAADGVFSHEEMKVVRTLLIDNFTLDPLGEAALRRILKTATDVAHDPELLVEVLAPVLPEEAHERVVTMLYATARADGEVHEAEQAFIDDLLARLGVHDHERYGPAGLRPCFEELELAPGATFDEVRAAWKRLVRDYHPDRVQHLAKGFQDYATRRVAAINDAYTTLKEALERSTPVAVEVELAEDDPTAP
jgi:DnaJ like chaperone protein